MRFSTVFLSLLSVSSALVIGPRQEASKAPELLSTIDDLSSAVTGLTNAVNAFDGSLLGRLPQLFEVVRTELKVDATTVKATLITKQSAPFTAAESLEIVQTLASQITPIQASLTALKNKYPLFKEALVRPVVLLDLKVLKAHTNDLVAAIKEKVTPDVAGLLDLGKGLLDGAFDSAIEVYSQ